MLGAIIGDMVGSKYEFHPVKTKEFNIFDNQMRITDDSLLTLAVARVLLRHYPIKYDEASLKEIKDDLCDEFVNTWAKNRHSGFGGFFYRWCALGYRTKVRQEPYNSFGNGSAMRISPVGWIARSEDELKLLSKIVTEITHNHPEGIKGAEAIALCIYLALHGASKEKIKERMVKEYYPEIKDLDFDELVKNYEFNETCQGSVPQAIYAFLISTSLEDTLRNCVAIGGDCDTTGAMAGAIAEAFYNKDEVSEFEDEYLYLHIDPEVEELIKAFHKTIDSKKFSSN